MPPVVFLDIGDDLLRQRVEILIRQRLVHWLDRHLDRHGLAALAERGTFEDVEDADAGDELAVGARRGALDGAGSTALSTTKAKSRFTAWKAERSSAGLVRVAFFFGSGMASR